MIHSKLTKVIVFYAVFMALGIFMCLWLVGKMSILSHASKSRPYGVLLHQGFYQSSSGKQNNPTIICFGDSNCTHLWRIFFGLTKRQDPQSGVKIGDWAYGGSDMFDYYCMFHRARRFSPDLVIVPINWRSFSSFWLSRKLFVHPELSAFVPFGEEFPPGYQNPLELNNISPARHLKYKMLFFEIYPLGIKIWAKDGLRNFSNKFLKSTYTLARYSSKSRGFRRRGRSFAKDPKQYKLRFPMRITDDNRQLCTLRSLAHSASQYKTKVLFFIWPLDQEYFAELGILNKDEIDRSRRLLLEASKADKAENIYFVDLSDFLEHKYFRDGGGHCTLTGRRKIAEALASKVLEILAEEPTPIDSGESSLANRPEVRLKENL